ncbi:MAG: beta-N-acetylhexosaminidase [Proteobacteria bacterium]|uniref:beta-N-acetylhexosaminidase n=1 Tax=Rudaea sp. TaxID=2136325 RepID=UPI00321F64E7|nr:beta-N-acetylhexosaminidase [Pseudomonadota bacterium]
MLIIGLSGLELTAAERGQLAAPQVIGVILFKRNFVSRAQVTALIDEIRKLRGESFLVSVDQEGGVVQRFRDGFVELPALARIGALYDTDPQHALARAEEHAWLMASEMRAIGVDLSFAPVLDLARGNRAIGSRAFDARPDVVSELGLAYARGMRLAGMAATLKHFPGHGSVLEDTHFDRAVDARSLAAIRAEDLLPFADGIIAGAEGVMMAHVAYPQVDAKPAGYSRVWIADILRGELGFKGVVFSDDISMAAGADEGSIAARIEAHYAAGCDLILACRPEVVDEALAATNGAAPLDPERLARLLGGVAQDWDEMVDNPQRQRFVDNLRNLP